MVLHELTRPACQISLHALVLPASVPSGAAGRDYRAALSTLYPPLLLAVNNLSGSLRDLGNEAATRLARVWLAFTAPAWVLMEEGSPRLVYCKPRPALPRFVQLLT